MTTGGGFLSGEATIDRSLRGHVNNLGLWSKNRQSCVFKRLESRLEGGDSACAEKGQEVIMVSRRERTYSGLSRVWGSRRQDLRHGREKQREVSNWGQEQWESGSNEVGTLQESVPDLVTVTQRLFLFPEHV